jgi:hypothetical protein
MFRPEGIKINFGKEDHVYIAFERSASMSRENRLAFVRADVYESLRERMMLGMNIGDCQLSKFYAYNALLFTSGARYNNTSILSDKKIIVIKNPKSTIENVNVITVEDDGNLRLTEKGLDLAQSIYQRHTILTDFLKSLGVSDDTASNDACKIEHVISAESFEMIKNALKCKYNGGTLPIGYVIDSEQYFQILPSISDGSASSTMAVAIVCFIAAIPKT